MPFHLHFLCSRAQILLPLYCHIILHKYIIEMGVPEAYIKLMSVVPNTPSTHTAGVGAWHLYGVCWH